MAIPANKRDAVGDYVCLYCEGRERYCDHCDSTGLVTEDKYRKQQNEMQAAYSKWLADRDWSRRQSHQRYEYGFEWARAYGEI